MNCKMFKEIRTSKSKYAEIIRFVIVGGIATAIQYAIYLVCLNVVIVSAQLSTIISYCISLMINFILSNVFTFKTKATTKKATGFVISHMINMGLQIMLVSAFSKIIPESYALFPAMMICIPINFILVRLSLKGRNPDCGLKA